jgi:hypothetical protein
MSSSLWGRPVPASVVRAETGDMLGRLKRLVELQAKVAATMAEEEDFLHGSMGVSFRAIGRTRACPSGGSPASTVSATRKQERVNGM